MMRRVVLILLLLVGSVALALWFEHQGGFVMIRLGDWTLQASLMVAVLGVLAVGLSLGFVSRLLGRVWRLPGEVHERFHERRGRLAREELVDGLVEIADGRYAHAEKRLQSASTSAVQPLFHHLLAAVAGQRRGDWAQRDEHIAAAMAAEPRAQLAIELAQAQLQVEAQQWDEANASLAELRRQAPQNYRVLSLSLETLQARGDNEALDALLPDLRKQQVLTGPALVALEQPALARSLSALGPTPPADALARVWRLVPRARRHEPALQACYARALIDAGHANAAERLLRRWLNARWDKRLVEVYGELVTDPPQQAYNQVTGWLKQRPEDAGLLFAAARQAAACALWGQARSYLEAAAARSDQPEVQRLLAELYERLDEPEHARRAYRRALGLDPSSNSLPPIEAPGSHTVIGSAPD